MPYRIEFTPSAARAFRKLPSPIQSRIAPKIDALAENPRPHGVEKMVQGRSEAASILDTFWITYDEGFRPPKPDTAASYSMIAHELTHILGDVGHTREHPNLMTDDESAGAKSGDLDDAQCAAIRLLR